jgi:hypothetical protein
MKVKSNLNAGFLGSIALVIVVGLAAPLHTLAITYCHDYVYSMITGQDSDGLGVDGLHNELMSRGYQWRATLKPGMPDEITDGDVLIFDRVMDDGSVSPGWHSAVVGYGRCTKINHFVQNYTQQRVPYTMYELMNLRRPRQKGYDDTLGTPLLRMGQTLQQIRSLKYPSGLEPFKSAQVQVWRPGQQVMLDWAPHDARFVSMIDDSFVQDPNPTWFPANDPNWRLSSADFNFSGVLGDHTVTLFLATKKANPSGFVAFVDPDTGAWSGWLPSY